MDAAMFNMSAVMIESIEGTSEIALFQLNSGELIEASYNQIILPDMDNEEIENWNVIINGVKYNVVNDLKSITFKH